MPFIFARGLADNKRLQILNIGYCKVWHDFILSIASRLLPNTSVLFTIYIHKLFNIYYNLLNIK